MSQSFAKAVCVHTYLGGEPVLAGFFRHLGKAGIFAYDMDYLARPDAYDLDPIHVPLGERRMSTTIDNGLFGAISDTCAQEWGNQAMYCLGQASTNGPHITGAYLHETLIAGSGFGVGALRFERSPRPGDTGDPADQGLRAYRIAERDDLTRLGELIARIESGGSQFSSESAELIRAGINLGGARPKLLVRAASRLWIAKFSRSTESVDVPAAEYLVNLMARECGIRTPECCLNEIRIGNKDRRVFMTRRFDRDDQGVPIHYLSAATLLGVPRLPDSPNPKTNVASYASLVELTRKISSNPDEDIRELFRRMVYNIIIGNRDDHLCNHAFLRDDDARTYRLSPAFDLSVDPVLSSRPKQALVCGDMGKEPSMTNILTGIKYFGIPESEAIEEIRKIIQVCDRMGRYFDLVWFGQDDKEWIRKCVMKNLDQRLDCAIELKAKASA